MSAVEAIAEDTGPDRFFFVKVALVAVAAGYFAWNSLYYFPYIVDDAFISLRYADNFVAGEGLVYNSSQRIEGYSNFSWVLLQALALNRGWPVIDFMKWLSVAAGAGAIGLTFALGRRLWPHRTPFAGLKTTLAVGMLGLNTSLALWAQAGLETVLLAALLTGAVWRYEIELRKPAAWPVSMVLFGLAWMTRPEVPAYVLYFLVRRAMLRRQRPFGSSDLRWLAALAGVVAPYEIWGLWYYGALLPATHAAKIGPGLDGLGRGLTEWAHQPSLVTFLTQQGWGLPVLLGLAFAGSALCRRLPAAVWVTSLSGLIFVLYAQGDWMPRHRLFVPFLPFLFLFIGHGIGELLSWSRRRRWILVLCAFGCTAAFVNYAQVQCFGGTRTDDMIAKRSRGAWFTEVPEQLSKRRYPVAVPTGFVLENVPPDEYVVLRDIGFPGFLSRNPIWDTVGLVTPTAARAQARGGEDDAAVFEELLDLEPGGFWLVLRDRNPGSLNHRIDEWLRSDPEASATWEQRFNTPGRKGRIVAYTRRDPGNFDVKARLAEAAARFPEYRHRLE